MSDEKNYKTEKNKYKNNKNNNNEIDNDNKCLQIFKKKLLSLHYNTYKKVVIIIQT